MPQPFRRDGFAVLPGFDALRLRPQFAAHVGIIAGMWSFIESKMASIVSTILHTDALVGATIYGVIRAEAARFAAIDAVANERLSRKDFDHWLALRKQVSSAGDQRNAVLHNVWSLPPQGVDGVLLIDSRKQALIHAAITTSQGMPDDATSISTAPRRHAIFQKHRDRMMLYKEEDFLNIEADFERLSLSLVAFDLKLSVRNLARVHESRTDQDEPPTEVQKR